MKFAKQLTFFFLLFICAQTKAQLPATDSAEVLEILPGAGYINFKTLPDGTALRIIVKNVGLRQGSTVIYSDSCVLNDRLKTFNAYGHVHIIDNDTAHVYSNIMRYLYDKKYAYLTGAVRLEDGQSTLTTNNLEYDVQRKIGIYKGGGKVVNKRTVVTSTNGIYYADSKDVYFKDKVLLKDPGYTVTSDSILYNTEIQVARFIAPTVIKDSSGSVIKTSEGQYDLRGGKATFTQRTTVVDKSLTVTADRIASDDATGIVEALGRAVLIDTAKGINILADKIYANKKLDAFLATQHPLMIIKQERDSIYVSADTLFSARLSDLFVDTSAGAKKVDPKDSTNRYFEAYRNVRIFSDSVQSASDSLFYSFKDSVFQLYQNPVVWSRRSQITGDTILLYTKNKKPVRVKVIEHSFMVSEVQPKVYNQIQSTRMDGYFKEGVIDSVRARGAAESIYFLQDDDSAFTGVNQTTSDLIDLFFEKGDLYKVVLRSNVDGSMNPIKKKSPATLRLKNFVWLDSRRPKTKYDLF